MKLIIDISEEIYDYVYTSLEENDHLPAFFDKDLRVAVRNSTSLGSLVYDIKKDIDENAEMSEDANYYLTRRDVFEILDKHTME